MGFDPILDTNDFLRKPTGLTDGDLLYWNSGALNRLPIGSTGQTPQVVGGLPSWANGAKDLFFARYGYTCWNISSIFSELATPLQIVDDTNTYSLNSSTAALRANWGNLITLMANSGADYGYISPYLSWETNLQAGHSTLPVTAMIYYTSSSISSLVHNTTTWTTKGGIATKIGSPTSMSIHDELKLYLQGGSGEYYSKTKDNKVWITDGYQCSIIPKTITSSWLSLNNFSSIKYIEFYDDGDSVKINNDTDLVFTGTNGQPTTLDISSNNIYWDTETDYAGITQVEIVSGNPLIVFEKA
ncbi:MAG: hypothetical protein KO464_07185 [Candidatus Methanofastidiosum sp.]|nr:hypothetical protein [Methanofastidiosum sp.]